jgi:hypothetical protein
MANKPTAMPNSMNTDFSMEQMKKTVIPIKKKVNRNFSFLEYLKYTPLIKIIRNMVFITNRTIIPQKFGLFKLK